MMFPPKESTTGIWAPGVSLLVDPHLRAGAMWTRNVGLPKPTKKDTGLKTQHVRTWQGWGAKDSREHLRLPLSFSTSCFETKETEKLPLVQSCQPPFPDKAISTKSTNNEKVRCYQLFCGPAGEGREGRREVTEPDADTISVFGGWFFQPWETLQGSKATSIKS